MSTTAPTSDPQDRPGQASESKPSEEQRDGIVLNLMLCDASGCPWSIEEITRIIGRVEAIDSLRRLQAAGLVHRIGDFVFPTLAARRAQELA